MVIFPVKFQKIDTLPPHPWVFLVSRKGYLGYLVKSTWTKLTEAFQNASDQRIMMLLLLGGLEFTSI